VVRSTAGSLWNIDLFEDIEMIGFNNQEFSSHAIYAFDGESVASLEEIPPQSKVIAIFGNEARGLPEMSEITQARTIRIPMSGGAESLNVASAASIAMFHLRQR
jgi:TrmH family RNA methyltransferase